MSITELPRVLIVDDDMVNQLVAYEILRRNNFSPTAVSSGEEAIETINTEPHFDVILMDIYMPDMDGMETCRTLRKIAGYEKTPVLALSGNSAESDKEACLSAGMNDYILKPFVAEDLIDTLNNWLAVQSQSV